MKKKVVLVLVDSLLPGPLEQAMNEGKAPNLTAIAKSGSFIKEGVTVFPTMSCSIDTSLVTGVFPDKHKIPGLVWYEANENRVVNYGSSFGTVWRLGFKQVLEDILYKLNKEHMSAKVETIFENLERKGRTVANINIAAYRGKQNHEVKLPFLVNVASGFSLKDPVRGCKNLALGKIVKPKLSKPYEMLAPTSLRKRYGINDEYSIEIFIELIRQNQLADLTLIYLPDLDQKVHKHGTKNMIKETEKIDEKIGRLLKPLGGVDKALEETIWIVISDHGQTDIDSNKKNALIPLQDLLKKFKIHNFREKVNSSVDDVVICNNERVAYIYPFRLKKDDIIEALKQDSKIDWIAYPDGNKVVVEKREQKDGYSDDLKLIYSKDGEYVDPYNQEWDIFGDMRALDLHVVGKHLTYKNYPDALMRLYGAIFAQRTKDVLIVTAKPGHEFESQGSASHNGGASHGSLHRQDSEIPIIIGGTDKKPKYPRIVDMKKFLMDLMQ
ncbi:alkaline phosphatase family protein [Desulfuribacillus alkaliarsenatis]|uniref:Phosphodiesterase n=1 Tax=Desulfuribacillus alkaliarsenatis TaxID=766136 RepID=A0A1E5G234_9FIRM|nr:alkaline phosphatase family protein [Desulfuribacillus alkaliarsenatis]OEF97031.1 hypothetical protein BHF68_05375 [Desulfuribacillus alkaliarsenatis]